MVSLIVDSGIALHLRLSFVVVCCSSLFLRLAAAENSTVVYAFINQTVRLSCPQRRSAATRIDWLDLVYNTDPQPRKIFSSFRGRQSLDASHPNRVNYDVDANFTLSIRNVKLDDAGAYNCTRNSTLFKSYYLAVSGFPTCNGTNPILLGQTGHYWCRSEFSGNYQPHLEWRREPDIKWPSVDNFEVRLAKKVFDLEASEADDRTNFTCRITFGSIVEECKINLNVFYPVRELSLDPIKDSFSVGEEIKCSADGSPTPEISFDPVLSPGRTGFGWRSATIPKSLGGQTTTVECIASNFVDGQLRTVRKAIEFTVESHDPVSGKEEEEENTRSAPSKSSSTSGAIVGGIVVGIMILVIIVAVIFCVRLRKDKTPSKEENGGTKTPPTSRDETRTQIKENQV